jgi:hypothetical protein
MRDRDQTLFVGGSGLSLRRSLRQTVHAGLSRSNSPAPRPLPSVSRVAPAAGSLRAPALRGPFVVARRPWLLSPGWCWWAHRDSNRGPCTRRTFRAALATLSRPTAAVVQPLSPVRPNMPTRERSCPGCGHRRRPRPSCSVPGTVAPPAGLEPAPPAPEAGALSAELRGRELSCTSRTMVLGRR